MRREYYILWLDDIINDELQNGQILEIIDEIEKHVKDLCFSPIILKKEDVNEALNYCNSSVSAKIDLFICDYNIASDKDGLSFLMDIRKQYMQDLILYSSNSKTEIKKKMIDRLSEEENINLFSRFSFESIINRENIDDFISNTNKIIDINVQKWNELNGLRGLYLAEISQIEMEIKEILLHTSNINVVKNIYNSNNIRGKWKNIIDDLFNNISEEKVKEITFSMLKEILVNKNDAFHTEWTEIAEIRNSLAHIKEDIDSLGPYIVSCKDSSRKIYESDIRNKRKQLFDFIDKVEQLIVSLGI